MRHFLLIPLVAALLALSPAPSLAAEPSSTSALTSPSLIAGAEAGDRLDVVDDVGDFDGDGIGDLLVAQHGYYGEFGTYEQGTAYVVFGRGNDAPVDLATPLGQRGIAIRFPTGWEDASVTAAGDVNGDGRGDLAVSASQASLPGRVEAGRIFVVFGRAGTEPITLTALGSGGYEIDGSGYSRMAGAIDTVPDVNGDGRDELLVSEWYPHRHAIVFGKSTTTNVDLAALGTGGYSIAGADSMPYPASVGDVNGDGRGDVAIITACEFCAVGDVTVIFGKPTSTAVNVAALGGGGFQIRFRHNAWPSYVGDVNGDGRDDIGVRSSYTGPRGDYFDDSYIVFGRTATSPLDLYALGDGGFAISGGGYPLQGIGDVDGDGRDDIMHSYSTGPQTAATAVLFGKSDSAPLDVHALLDRGFLLESTWTDSSVATATFGAGPRIALNYRSDDPYGRREAGSVRLVAPPAPQFAVPSARVYTAGSAIAPIAVTDERRASPLRFAVTPALPTGLQLDPATGTISGTPAQAAPVAVYTVTATDRLGTSSRAISLRIDGDAYATTAPADGASAGERPTLVWQRASAPDDSEPVGAYSVVVDGTALGTVPAEACGPASCSLTVPNALADGPHRWHVETTARDGRPRSSPSATFTVVALPTARLALSAAALHTGAPLQLDASGSSDVNGAIASYAFDLDGDGSFESASGDPRRTATFATPGDRRLGVRVTDAGGSTSEAFATVHVAPAPPAGEPGISINDGALATNDPQVTLSLVWPALADGVLVSNDGGFGAVGGTRAFALTARIPWRLSVAGSERLPRIAYARYRGGTAGLETHTDDIILDQRPPQVAAARLTGSAPSAGGRARSAAGASGRRVTLAVTARDDNTGVREVVVAKRRGGKAIVSKQLTAVNRLGRKTAKTTVRLPAGTRTAWVRVTDVAGNRSPWRAAATRSSRSRR